MGEKPLIHEESLATSFSLEPIRLKIICYDLLTAIVQQEGGKESRILLGRIFPGTFLQVRKDLVIYKYNNCTRACLLTSAQFFFGSRLFFSSLKQVATTTIII